ncbi:hypothetical protein LCGC14_3150790 [marine sediment metagenome]|uniref:uroporphyrinogen-III C-methyltransferase n=1 Tax=marine sediment metagenome TaxID=412755 RepID=A0A0F8WI97_9ZZZZ
MINTNFIKKAKYSRFPTKKNLSLDIENHFFFARQYYLGIQKLSKSKVYLIGAGPGDLELMTLKGYRLICEADVVLYDHLIPMEVLSHAKHGAELISVGKFAGDHTLRQEKIKEVMELRKFRKGLEKIKENDKVEFIKEQEKYEQKDSDDKTNVRYARKIIQNAC